jgi:hypothetical protein
MATKKQVIETDEVILVKEDEVDESEEVVELEKPIKQEAVSVSLPEYSKVEILGHYSKFQDYLNVVLDADRVYTIPEIETILEEVR